MTNSSQKDNKPSAAKAEASKSRASTRTPPGVAFPQMAPPPELVAMQRVMQGHGETGAPVQRQEAEASMNATGLPDGLKAGVERLSGLSLDDVRVHYDSDKPAQVGALAYTQGTEIHVGPGKESSVPHEAWHAVQQLQGRVEPNVQFKGKVPGNDDKGLEDEADRKGAEALALSQQDVAPMQSLSQSTNATPVVQRDEDGEAEPASKADVQEKVDVSEVAPEQQQTFEVFIEGLCKMPVHDYAALIPQLPEESTQLWLLKLRSDEPEFMKVVLDAEWGFQLADKLIRKPKNPIPNYLAIINHINLGDVIPTRAGEALQTLFVTLPHAILSGLFNAIPALLGRMQSSDVFFANAITARYGVEITAADWTTEEMRNIWNSFKMVPRTHVMGPVKAIDHVPGIESGFGGRKGAITMAKLIPQSITMGGAEAAIRPFSKFLMKRSKYSDRMRGKNAFSMTTLHEIGHAVDVKLGVMTKYRDREEFGRWVDTTPNEIFTKWWSKDLDIGAVEYSAETRRLEGLKDTAQQETAEAMKLDHDVIANRSKKTAAQGKSSAALKKWQAQKVEDEDVHWEARIGIPKSLFDNLGEYLAKGTSIESKVNEYVPITGTMTRAEIGAAKARRSGMLAKINNLPPTRMIKHGLLSKMGWNVDRKTGHTLSEQFGGKVFHEAYANDWVGYDIDAKDDGVSHYQFRAAKEFFAELYCHYYMDTLISKDGKHKHSLYDFMDQAIAKNPDCDPATMKKAGEVTLSSSLIEGGVEVPVPASAVVLESGDESAAPTVSSSLMDEKPIKPPAV